MVVGDSGSVRKTRSDKKKEVKPTLTIELKDAIYQLSNITRTPIKDVCEYLCIAMVSDRKNIEKLSGKFQHDLIYDGTMFRGSLDNEPISKRFAGRTSTVTIKFKAHDYDAIYKLAFALSVSPSRAVAILLRMGMSDVEAINQYIKDYLQAELSERQMNDLKELLRYLNSTNGNHHTWASLLSQIHDDSWHPMLALKDIVRKFLSNK